MNLNTDEPRRLVIQAGAFGEHRFGRGTYSGRSSDWRGELGGYAGTYAPRRSRPRSAASKSAART